MDATLSNQLLWAGVLAMILPFLISTVIQPTWSARTKATVAMAFCVLGALGSCYYEGALTAADIGRSIMLVVTATQALYKAYYKPAGLTDAVERATSPKGEGA